MTDTPKEIWIADASYASFFYHFKIDDPCVKYIRADLVGKTTPVKLADCENCEGHGRIQCLPDSSHTHPCDECQPGALKEFNRGVAFADSEEYAAEKSPPQLVSPDAAHAALQDFKRSQADGFPAQDETESVIVTLLQQAAQSKGGDGGGK